MQKGKPTEGINQASKTKETNYKDKDKDLGMRPLSKRGNSADTRKLEELVSPQPTRKKQKIETPKEQVNNSQQTMS